MSTEFLIYILSVAYKLGTLAVVGLVLAIIASIVFVVLSVSINLPVKSYLKTSLRMLVLCAIMVTICPSRMESYVAMCYVATKAGCESFADSRLGKAAIEYIEAQVAEMQSDSSTEDPEKKQK